MLVAYGEGFWVLSEAGRFEATYPRIVAGWLDPDLYLYLATDDRLLLYDAAGLPLERLGVRPLGGIRALSGFVLR